MGFPDHLGAAAVARRRPQRQILPLSRAKGWRSRRARFGPERRRSEGRGAATDPCVRRLARDEPRPGRRPPVCRAWRPVRGHRIKGRARDHRRQSADAAARHVGVDLGDDAERQRRRAGVRPLCLSWRDARRRLHFRRLQSTRYRAGGVDSARRQLPAAQPKPRAASERARPGDQGRPAVRRL